MKELTIWNYNSSEIRTLTLNNEPWWVLTDVCKILEISHIKDTVNRLDKDEVGQTEVIDKLGRKQTANIINESGLYSVILRSDKPQAKPFRKWVTSEVLPAIRKTGMYATDELLNNPDLAIKAFTALKEERAKTKALTETVAVQQQQILEMKPKASYYETVLNCKDLLSTTEIAKDYGRSARWLNDLLHEMKVQYKQGGKIWILYQKYAEKGYTSTKTQTYNGKDGEVHTKVHTYWTQKGRLFIYDLLKSKGILPLIEQEKSA